MAGPAVAEEAGDEREDIVIWNGWRLTLNCGHLELTDLENRAVGKLTTCDLCPLNTHDESSPGTPGARGAPDRGPPAGRGTAGA